MWICSKDKQIIHFLNGFICQTLIKLIARIAEVKIIYLLLDCVCFPLTQSICINQSNGVQYLFVVSPILLYNISGNMISLHHSTTWFVRNMNRLLSMVKITAGSRYNKSHCYALIAVWYMVQNLQS